MDKPEYSAYLQLDKLLNAQSPESDRLNMPAHDEHLFIIIHQAYELWFKQVLHEIHSCQQTLKKPALNDNSPELQTVVHRLGRVGQIIKLLVQQIDVLETMTPMDFLDFRDMLRPASGFQSWQFKLIETRLGLRFQQRHGKELYMERMKPENVEVIRTAEEDPSLLQLVNAWLERMPFFDEPENWNHYQPRYPKSHLDETPATDHIFWIDYRRIYAEGLSPVESAHLDAFDLVFKDRRADYPFSLSVAASRAALFIMLFRGYPVLQLPFQLLNNLLEIDEQLSTWRYRHMNMVQRMIGTRIGTGGSSGRDYLSAALDKHYIFKDIAALTSFLTDRRRLPSLSAEMERRLGFVTN
jgi:tryptophan 2,3-dioxygenase